MGLSFRSSALSWMLAVGAVASGPCRAHAAPEESAPALYAVVAQAEAQAAVDDGRARIFLAALGELSAEPLLTYAPKDAGETVSRDALLPLSEVERLLYEARELAARFDEAAAFQRLLAAERLLLENLELPHVHAFLAEVDLALGLAAAQLSQPGLAETKLSRALSLDPARRLRAGEAPPQLEAFARALEKQGEGSPLSELRIEVDPSDAEVWLDGHRVGRGRTLQVRKGSHVLRVGARGYRPYAALVELGAGRRLPLQVSLSPTPEEQARQTLLRALADPARALRAAPLFARQAGRTVWLFELGSSARRVLVHRCQPDCELVAGLEGETRVELQALRAFPADWLHTPASVAPVVPVRHEKERGLKRWRLVLVSAALAVGAGVTVAALLTRDHGVSRERSLTLDPGELPR